MTLREFFRKNPFVTKKDMAIALDTDAGTVFRWCRDEGGISLSMALKIEEFTKGKVTASDLCKGKKK